MSDAVTPEVSAYFSEIGRKGGKKRNLGTEKAKEIGRKGGLKKKLDPEKAKEIGRLGALKRWGKKPETT